MKKRMGMVVWAIVLACGLLPSRAVADDVASGTYVVLVGIDKYEDPKIKSREHAEADAQALYDLFINKAHGGVKTDNIKLLLGKEDEARGSSPATRDNVLKALAWLEKSAQKDDLVLFAFLGNGAPLGERSCYFTVDANFEN